MDEIPVCPDCEMEACVECWFLDKIVCCHMCTGPLGEEPS